MAASRKQQGFVRLVDTPAVPTAATFLNILQLLHIIMSMSMQLAKSSFLFLH